MAASPIAQEAVPSGEERYTNDLLARLKAKLLEDNPVGIMRRDAHPKMHGAVKAEFIVEPNLPPQMRVGIFSEAKTYPAWIRFSNGAQTIQPDIKRDIRGMAIKVMSVPGEKILENERNERTHDFILASTSFFMKDVATVDAFAKATTGSILAKVWFGLAHWRVLWMAFKSFRKFANPLQIRYFSCTPYLFGTEAVKYSAIPAFAAPDPIPDPPSDDYLRLAIASQLKAGEMLFDFAVQFRTDADAMPIEDSGREWRESRSPFRKVATIRILRQDCDNDEQRRFGENLSFTPWHALPEHRPLGGINRGRKTIYEAISSFRHQYNRAARKEPNSWEL